MQKRGDERLEQMDFRTFFRRGSGFDPFPYQVRLAEAEQIPLLVNAPTGTGKTLAALGAWLWRHARPGGVSGIPTPRRLVYCLPLRTLVNQTFDEAKGFVERVGLSEAVPVYRMMGGEANKAWLLHPERKCVIVGTQDMLLSRALNRGYAQSRFAWPRSFGLLNNDCLWVFDEVQLMSSGLATSAQLHGLRQRFGTFIPCSSMWMSATMDPTWFDVPDFTLPGEDALSLAEVDLVVPEISKRVEAVKTVHRFGAIESGAAGLRSLAVGVLDEHAAGSQTLVVLNTVERARGLYGALSKELEKRKGGPVVDLLLAHSRFRRHDRDRLEREIKEKPGGGGGRIIVSTQVIEAGVNIDSATLFTELAPWPSLVQRLGRCNRFGKEPEARVFWLDLEDKQYPPYEPEEMEPARESLHKLEGRSASPRDLARLDAPMPSPTFHFSLRAKDLVELFDTSPDLAGDDTDVSRFIREGESLDVSVFWRDIEETPEEDDTSPHRDELCPVPLGELRGRLADDFRAWIWDFIDGRWRVARGAQIYPGAVVMLRASAGGYCPQIGWSPESMVPVEVVGEEPEAMELEGTGEDSNSFDGDYRWVTVEEHSRDTLKEVQEMVGALGTSAAGLPVPALERAAALHDTGKASPLFQDAMLSLCDGDPPSDGTQWAKAPGRNRRIRYKRDYFRHELASALALLAYSATDALSELEVEERDLAVYLVASHHGRVRLGIRPVPGEKGPPDGRRFALGVWEGDELPEVRLGPGLELPAVRLDLGCMELGGSGGFSWSEMAAALCESPRLGPFRLAYMEALLRAGDARASIRERGVE